MPTSFEECGKFVTHLVPRNGSWYPCALEVGHGGDHRAGGMCFRHGKYIGEPLSVPCCPHYPTCARNAPIFGAVPYEEEASDAEQSNTPSPKVASADPLVPEQTDMPASPESAPSH